jgi:hypothetical protein
VAEQFLRVNALQESLGRLFRPSMALRVLLDRRRRHPEPAIDTTTRMAVSGPRT